MKELVILCTYKKRLVVTCIRTNYHVKTMLEKIQILHSMISKSEGFNISLLLKLY